MTCYNPKIRIEDLSKWERAKDGHLFHPAKIVSQESLNDLETLKKYLGGNYKQTIIPCQKCIGCRLENSQQWANRAYLESLSWEQNWFVTLTYDEDNKYVPDYVEDENGITWTDEYNTWNGTLIPSDLQQFNKNLRQIMKRDFNEDNIRFIACGEYGSETKRPHYHLIIFNLNLPLEDLYKPRIINENIYFQSHIIERAWTKGISNISEATWNNMAYTARYITKKINGKNSSEFYASQGQEKEFFRASNRPGIGLDYYEKHKEEIYKNDYIIIKNQKGVHKAKPPKYFDDKYKSENPKKFKEIQLKREKLAQNNAKAKDMMTSIFRREQLEIEERTKLNQSKILRRTLE